MLFFDSVKSVFLNFFVSAVAFIDWLITAHSQNPHKQVNPSWLYILEALYYYFIFNVNAN